MTQTVYLSPREREIIQAHFGFGGFRPHSLEELSSGFHVTQERIRQIKTNALRKLRHTERSKILEDLSRIYYYDDESTSFTRLANLRDAIFNR